MKPNIKSKSEHFSRNMFFDSLVRLKSVLLPYCIFLAALGPLMTFLIIANDRSTNDWRIGNDGKLDIDSYILFGIFLVAVLFCILVTLMLTRYLHQKNEADVFMALSVKRENMVFLRMAAGGVFLVIPLLLSFAATEMVLHMNRDWIHINIDIHIKLFGSFIFFMTVSYIMLFLSALIANTAADTIIFCIILQIVLPVLGYLTFFLIRSGNLGFPYSAKWIENIFYLSPALAFWQYRIYLTDLEYFKNAKYYYQISAGQFENDIYNARNFNTEQMNLWPILCWSIIIIVLLFLIRMLAEKRKAENAGRKGLTGIFSTISLCIFIFAGAEVTTLVFTTGVKEIAFWRVPGYALLGGTILGFAIYGLLNKGYNNMLKKAWKPYFFSILASISIISIIYYAPFLDYTPPEINDIEFISVKNLNTSIPYYPTTEEMNEILYGEYEPYVSIQNITDMEKIISGHQALINSDCFINETFMNNAFEITYHMKNGNNRKLGFNLDGSMDASKIFYEMRGEEYIRKTNAIFSIQPEQIVDIEISEANENFSHYTSSIFIEHDAGDILDALRADILELNDKTYEDFWTFNDEGIYEIKEDFCGYISILIKTQDHRNPNRFVVSRAWISIHSEYTRTISWLCDNGYAEYLEKTSTRHFW